MFSKLLRASQSFIGQDSSRAQGAYALAHKQERFPCEGASSGEDDDHGLCYLKTILRHVTSPMTTQ